jgi:hypothetical protein
MPASSLTKSSDFTKEQSSPDYISDFATLIVNAKLKVIAKLRVDAKSKVDAKFWSTFIQCDRQLSAIRSKERVLVSLSMPILVTLVCVEHFAIGTATNLK